MKRVTEYLFARRADPNKALAVVKGGEEISPRANTVLTKKIRIRFYRLVKRGIPMDAVCDYIGISGYAFWSWMQRGTMYWQLGEEPAKDRVYGLFVRRVKKATAIYRMNTQKKLEKAKGSNWIKFMAILERRDRKTFSKDDSKGGLEESLSPDERYV